MDGPNSAASTTDAALPQAGSLAVCFDDSAGATIRCVLLAKKALFVESIASRAEVIVFGTDSPTVLSKSPLFRAYPSKSICITETDIPTFRIPGLYAANKASYITRSRTRTINYFISEHDNPNSEISRYIGRHNEKRYLYSFMGGTNSWARRWLFRSVHTAADTFVEATDSYNHWTDDPGARAAQLAQRRHYAEVMAASKYALCPRGCGLSSYRLFEAMSLGIAPVIISDNWRPTHGVDWRFAIFLPERHIAHIDRIVRSHESEWEERGRAALSVYQTVFAKDAIANTIHGQIVSLLSTYSPTREAFMQVAAQVQVAKRAVDWKIYQGLKYVVLRAFYIAGLSFPFKLHDPLGELPLRARKPS